MLNGTVSLQKYSKRNSPRFLLSQKPFKTYTFQLLERACMDARHIPSGWSSDMWQGNHDPDTNTEPPGAEA